LPHCFFFITLDAYIFYPKHNQNSRQKFTESINTNSHPLVKLNVIKLVDSKLSTYFIYKTNK